MHPVEHEGRPLRFFSANNTLKTYYGPLLLRPLSFLRCASAGWPVPLHLISGRPWARL